MKDLVIRPADETDKPCVLALAQGFATSFNVELSAFESSYSQILKSKDAQLLVAAEDDCVVGYCLAFDHRAFFANGRVTWVEEIMVTEETRRSGVGRALMASIEQWATQRQSKLVALATRRAAEFYKAIGYEESATYFRKVLADA